MADMEMNSAIIQGERDSYFVRLDDILEEVHGPMRMTIHYAKGTMIFASDENDMRRLSKENGL